MVGGADFLGWYALDQRLTIAARQFCCRGVPYFQGCPSRNLAAYFLMGSDDFRYRSANRPKCSRFCNACHDKTVMLVIPGGTHESTIGVFPQMVRAEDPQVAHESYSDGERPELSRKRRYLPLRRTRVSTLERGPGPPLRAADPHLDFWCALRAILRMLRGSAAENSVGEMLAEFARLRNTYVHRCMLRQCP